jgi:heme exporter protein A
LALDFDFVEAVKLTKLFGATRALGSVSLRFEAGQVTVVEGHNGSGKSTLLSILGQLAQPTRGEVKYGELDRRRHAAALRARMGILAHAPMLYPDLTARENLNFYARLFSLENRKQVVEAQCERFQIGRFADRPVRTYSRGQLQRVALARAVMHQPRLLLLDEPSTGLDVLGVERLEKAILAERDRGAIGILVTHDADFAGRVADRRVRLERGRVIEEASAA